MDETQNQNLVPQVSNMPGMPGDSSNRTLMAILAYLGILILVPILAEKNDPFVKFHVKQGVRLIIYYVVVWILSVVIAFSSVVLGSVVGALFSLIAIIIPILWIGGLIFVILGIVNVVNGKTAPLPIIGAKA